MRFFLPKQPSFFDAFASLSEKQIEVAFVLRELAGDFHNVAHHAKRAKVIEHEADEITHAILDQVNATFVTPLDREDIYLLTQRLDDIVDLIENAITNIRLYHIREKRPEFDEFAALIVRTAREADTLVRQLEHRAMSAETRRLVVAVHQCEDEGDEIFQRSIERLFREKPDPLVIITWKDIFADLEEVVDTYQALSDTVESVLVKAS